jgi:hypothetical protein
MKATYIWQMINQVPWYLLFFIFLFFLRRFCAFLNKGSSKTPLKTFWESPCQKLLAEKVERKKNFFPFIFSHGVFVRFSTRGVQKHYKKLFGESPCQKLLAEKVEEKKSFSCRLFPSIFFYRVFGRFSA